MYVEALEQVNLAIKLEAENPECWFIKSKVEIDRGDTYSAMATIQRAEELGKNRYLCDLLRARALVFWKDSIRIKTVEHAIYTTDENGKPVTIPERIEEEVITKEMPERKRQARKLLAGVTKSGVLEGTDLVEVRRLEEELSSMKYSEI